MLQDLLDFKQYNFSITFMDFSELALHDTTGYFSYHLLISVLYET